MRWQQPVLTRKQLSAMLVKSNTDGCISCTHNQRASSIHDNAPQRRQQAAAGAGQTACTAQAHCKHRCPAGPYQPRSPAVACWLCQRQRRTRHHTQQCEQPQHVATACCHTAQRSAAHLLVLGSHQHAGHAYQLQLRARHALHRGRGSRGGEQCISRLQLGTTNSHVCGDIHQHQT